MVCGWPCWCMEQRQEAKRPFPRALYSLVDVNDVTTSCNVVLETANQRCCERGRGGRGCGCLNFYLPMLGEPQRSLSLNRYLFCCSHVLYGETFALYCRGYICLAGYDVDAVKRYSELSFLPCDSKTFYWQRSIPVGHPIVAPEKCCSSTGVGGNARCRPYR